MAPLIFNAVRQQMFQRVAAVSPLGRNRSAEDVAHCAFSVFFFQVKQHFGLFLSSRLSYFATASH